MDISRNSRIAARGVHSYCVIDLVHSVEMTRRKHGTIEDSFLTTEAFIRRLVMDWTMTAKTKFALYMLPGKHANSSLLQSFAISHTHKRCLPKFVIYILRSAFLYLPDYEVDFLSCSSFRLWVCRWRRFVVQKYTLNWTRVGSFVDWGIRARYVLCASRVHGTRSYEKLVLCGDQLEVAGNFKYTENLITTKVSVKGEIIVWTAGDRKLDWW